MEPPGGQGKVPCPFCQQPIASDSLTCRWCGEAVGPGFAPPKPTPPSPRPPAAAGRPPPPAPSRVEGSPGAPGIGPMLRQMTAIQILDASFRLYRDNFFLFLGIMAVAYVPLVVAGMGIMGALLVASTARGADQASAQAAALGVLCGILLLAILVQWIAIPLATGALTQAVSNRYLSRPATIGSSYRGVFRIFFSFLLTAFLVGLLVGLGFLFCLAPGIILFCMFAFVTQIMILERSVGTDAMGRSTRLTEGHRWRIFGLAVIMFVSNFLLSMTISFTFQFILKQAIPSEVTRVLLEQGANQITQMLLQPLWSVAWVLLYYDVRIRKEGFDLQILAQRMG